MNPDDSDARDGTRSNVFLAAVLHWPGLSIPVKVRNMSVTGALIEAPTVPPQGAEARLVRGSLAVSGSVAWSTEGRCGLRFSSLLCVRDWLAPPANNGQQRVDEMVGLLKLGAIPMPIPSSAADSAGQDRRAQFLDDLHRLSRLLESVGDGLSGDVYVVERHAGKLQSLDIAVQTIAALAEALTGTADMQASAERLENLRASCAQALAGRG